MTRPIVLLHGFTGSPASWDAVLRRPGALTPADARTLTPALLGHDGTPGPAGVESFDDELDRLAGEIRAPGLAAAHLVGYSMGGRLALGLLDRHPDLFASATLVGASPGLADPAEREARAARDEEWARLLDEEGLDSFVAAWEAVPLFETQARLPRDVLDHQRGIRRSHDPRGLARSLRVAGLARMPDYRPRLDRMTVPIRLVVGERDARFRALADEMAARLPAASLTLVPDAGHNVILERPAEIAALIREDRSE